jgi:hypothetical protein
VDCCINGFDAGYKKYKTTMQICACEQCATICNACDKFDTLSPDCVKCIHSALNDPMCAAAANTCSQTPNCSGFSTCAYSCL